MERTTILLTLVLSGAIATSAGVQAAQTERPLGAIREAALVGPTPNIGTLGSQSDVIEPPSSVDPGMAIDPPQTGAKMPVIHPPGIPGGWFVLPR